MKRFTVLVLLLLVCLLAVVPSAYAAMLAGGTWAEQTSGTTAMLGGVDFVDATHGWAVGSGGTILATTNGGATWTAQTSGVDSTLGIQDVSFVDASHGWVVGDLEDTYGSAVLRTTSNGGATWTKQDLGPANLCGVDFVDATHGWAVSLMGTIYATTNGGATWTTQRSVTRETLFDLDFVDASHGFAVGYLYTGSLSVPLILATTDGGASWTVQGSGLTPGNGSLFSVCFVDASHGWVVGEYYPNGPKGLIAATTDGGATWTRQDAGATQTIWDAAFVDASRGWALATPGAILATTDGGATWTAQASGLGYSLRAVDFADASHGWAVGSPSHILAYAGGGGTDTTPPTTTASGAVNGKWYKAAVTVSLAATDNAGGSGVAYSEYKLDAGEWTKGTQVRVSGDLFHTVLYRSADKAGNVEVAKTLKVGIDTHKPITKAPASASARRGRSALLRYQVLDPVPNGGTATVTIKIKNSAGKVVATLRLGAKPVNTATALSRSFKVPTTWRIGVYRYSVYATDKAGNAQVLPVGSNKLTVR